MLAQSEVMEAVPLHTLALEPLLAVVGTRRTTRILAAIEHARAMLSGRAIWHINSTAAGGGVAELLHSLLAYARGAGVDVRWSVMGGNAEFFRITKGLHNRLHGIDSEQEGITEADRREYTSVCEENAEALAEAAGQKPN